MIIFILDILCIVIMNHHVNSNEKILSGLLSPVFVKHDFTHNHNQIHLNPLIPMRDVHVYANLSKIPHIINITTVIERPIFFQFKSHSLILDCFTFHFINCHFNSFSILFSIL